MKLKRTMIEICAGAGGQALGLEMAGFQHRALIENDKDCCATLRHNRPRWNVLEQDLQTFSGASFGEIDLLAGGLPCPPFSVAGKQLGQLDERNLFPDAIRLTKEINPKAVMLENVRGFLGAAFEDYRAALKSEFESLGYRVDWHLIQSSDFGVPQLRPRVVIVALKRQYWPFFEFPISNGKLPKTVGKTLKDLMAENGWAGTQDWADSANKIAPTIVGGSKKHGGPDLGPTRAREAWKKLGVNGSSIAEFAPDSDFCGNPRLTVKMVARLQGFPDSWAIQGKKTAAYRQVGNAFPAPVAKAFGLRIGMAIEALEKAKKPMNYLEAV